MITWCVNSKVYLEENILRLANKIWEQKYLCILALSDVKTNTNCSGTEFLKLEAVMEILYLTMVAFQISG